LSGLNPIPYIGMGRNISVQLAGKALGKMVQLSHLCNYCVFDGFLGCVY
jgi:hypothetical protein